MIVRSSEEVEEDHQPLQGTSSQSAGRARNVTRGFLSAVAARAGAETDAVLLVVSELVTNAVRHAGGVTRFHLAAGPGTVTVSVEDASTIAPQPRRTDAVKPGGFGWHLVQALSADVRVSIGPRGKTVSAVLPLSH
ncbi:ATP-binding protein [Streptomyces ureilyticus]|uniref:ATP-binding protein n=1 Tax=Streptomyces ureilyticus TaxID=1775131 RepID=A0ABX0DJQ0_9ACTN|nr:ATP-binding protein [Streptomyces ureilyticus]NGO41782.1 ATP-binding protein [Streptomyces ureilyticus]